jgi:hypothetical protein
MGERGAQKSRQSQQDPRRRPLAGKNRMIHRETPDFFRLRGSLGGPLTSR